MSCKHGNWDCDLCREEDEAYKSTYESGKAAGQASILELVAENDDWAKGYALLFNEHAKLRAQNELLTKLVADCQNDLATWIVSDSGISDHDVLSTLLGRLDGPQSREAMSVEAPKGRV